MKRFLIKINGKTYDAEVEVVGTSASAPVAAPAAAPPCRCSRCRSGSCRCPRSRRPRQCHLPLPGTVLRLCKNTGDTVAAGEVVMIVESMKMENEVVAPEGGRIASIAVAAGSAINTGDLLFTLG